MEDAFTKELEKGWNMLVPVKEIEEIIELSPMKVHDQLDISTWGICIK